MSMIFCCLTSANKCAIIVSVNQGGFNISLCFLFELIKYSDIIEKNYDKLNENDYSESHRDRIILQFLSYKILDYYFEHKMEYNATYGLLVKNYVGFTYSKKIN